MDEKKTIYQIMKTAKITQQQLADRLNINQSAVSKMLNPSTDPKLSTLRKLSRELGVSLEDLAATYNERQKSEGGETEEN